MLFYAKYSDVVEFAVAEGLRDRHLPEDRVNLIMAEIKGDPVKTFRALRVNDVSSEDVCGHVNILIDSLKERSVLVVDVTQPYKTSKTLLEGDVLTSTLTLLDITNVQGAEMGKAQNQRRAVQLFTCRAVLVKYLSGQPLEFALSELRVAMRDGPQSWAFKKNGLDTKEVDDELVIHYESGGNV